MQPILQLLPPWAGGFWAIQMTITTGDLACRRHRLAGAMTSPDAQWTALARLLLHGQAGLGHDASRKVNEPQA